MKKFAIVFIGLILILLTTECCHKEPNIHSEVDYFQQASYPHRGIYDSLGTFYEGYTDEYGNYHSFATESNITSVMFGGTIYTVQNFTEYGTTELWYYVYNSNYYNVAYSRVNYYKIIFSVLLENGEWQSVESDGYDVCDHQYNSIVFDTQGIRVIKVIVLSNIAY